MLFALHRSQKWDGTAGGDSTARDHYGGLGLIMDSLRLCHSHKNMGQWKAARVPVLSWGKLIDFFVELSGGGSRQHKDAEESLVCKGWVGPV